MALLLSSSASATIVSLSSSSPSPSSIKPLKTLPFLISTHNPNRKLPGRARNLSTLRVAVPATSPQTTDPERPTQTEQDGDEYGAEDELEDESSTTKFNWRDHWYPVSLIEDLDPRLPTPFQLLGRDLVFWFDKASGEWVAFDDKCPHRLAPLSEGRIDEGGNLQCSYHGWSFDGCGTCVKIPQASPEGPEARAVRSSRACTIRFPTLVSQGLLFVWPDENGWERANATKPPM